jgi:hypothetical protein
MLAMVLPARGAALQMQARPANEVLTKLCTGQILGAALFQP